MQIHELNGYSGALDDAYMAVDNGSDTGKKKIQDITDPLNARIDNIIAGPASSAQEVIDARLGADSVVYPSLGDAIRDQVTDIKSSLKEFVYSDEIVNLFDYTTRTYNGFVDGNSVVTINGYYCSDFIEVKPDAWYCIPYTAEGIGSVFDENKTYLGKLRRSDRTQPSADYGVFKTNASTKYVRVNGYNYGGNASINVSPSKYMLIEGTIYPNEYIKYNSQNLQISYNGSNYLHGKTILTYGDSITEGELLTTDPETGFKLTYAGIVAKRNGMNFENLGWSGSTMADDGLKPFIHNGQIYSHFDNKYIVPDYITVWFGWNDYAHPGITLGTITSEDESTYYGAYIKACKLLIQKFPLARIGLIVPYGMDADWRNAVRIVAGKFGLPYLDLYNNCPCIYNDEAGVVSTIATQRQSTFLGDGTHPNELGYEWIANAYEAFLRRI